MQIEELQARLRAARMQIGNGRFSFTMDGGVKGDFYVTHWFRPDPHAFEDCKAVGSGTVAECLAALDRYVAEHAPVPALAAE